MKYSTTIVVFFGLILSSSCSNEKVEKQIEEPVDIVGFWEGTITVDKQPDIESQYVNFLIKKDGTITNEGKWFSETKINIGVWSLNGNDFKYSVSNIYGSINPNPISGTATFDASGKLTNGIWQNLSGTNSGTFEMVKRK